MVTPYQLHVNKWKDCTRCELHERRCKTVLGRGKIPCDVVFVGEAPGESENVIGVPFVGPAGQLLDHIMRQAMPDTIRYAITNLVACIPYDDESNKTAEPSQESVKACSQRLMDFVFLCQPKLIVAVGKCAEEYLKPGYKHSIKLPKLCEICGSVQTSTRSGMVCERGHGGADAREIKQIAITHPASILRTPVAMQSIAIKRCIVTLQNATEDL